MTVAKSIWYHGGPKLTYLSSIKWDRDRFASSQNSEGPGLYWTTDRDEASTYGAHLYSATMRPEFRLMPNRRPTLRFLMGLYNAAQPEDRECFLSNWDDHVYPSPKSVMIKYSHQNTYLDAAVTLYHDLFRHDADEYVAAVRELYDGAIVKRGETGGSKPRKHLVCWSPEKLVIQDV